MASPCSSASLTLFRRFSMEQNGDYRVILGMNILIGIGAIAIILGLLGLGTFIGGKELNTTCSGDASCSVCSGDVNKCENREDR